MKLLIVLHRYLGVVVGLVMTLWCLSGFVMMYQGYPAFTRAEALRTLQPLDARAWPLTLPALQDEDAFRSAEVRMLAGRPVLRVVRDDGPAIYDLRDGAFLEGFDAATAGAVATTYGDRTGAGEPARIEPIKVDQWSVGVGASRHQPLHRVSFADRAKTQVYVSGVTGEIVQDTTGRERLLGWLGAVPHWLYPTLLRQNSALWSQVVIWASVIGVFLTVTGLYVGIARFKRYKSGRWSPYRGWFYWHHITGLVFGVLTLTWVFSGLLTMNPWGWLETRTPLQREDYGGRFTWSALRPALERAPAMLGAGKVARLSAKPIAGQLAFVAHTSDGGKRRFDTEGRPAALSEVDVRRGLAALGAKPQALDLLREEDAYYYGHHSPVTLPVWRAVLSEPAGTRIYIDAVTGAPERLVDANARLSRWAENGFHSLDFARTLRWRPVWDLVVLPLLLGVTLACATGAYMSIQRVGRDAGSFRRALRRPAKA